MASGIMHAAFIKMPALQIPKVGLSFQDPLNGENSTPPYGFGGGRVNELICVKSLN